MSEHNANNFERGDRGRFAGGGPPGPGRPKGAGPQIRFRATLYAALTDADVTSALQTLRDVMADVKAKPADRLAAAREILDRACGRPLPPDLEDLVVAAEAIVFGKELP